MRARSVRAGLGLVCVVALVLVAGCRPAPRFDPPAGPIGRLHHEGRWLVDASGRVVQLHGTNFVQKFPPVAPAAVGFDTDDARFLREQGFNVVRLGVVFGAVMPEPGVIDQAYVDSYAQTVRDLARERIYTLVDWHQDGFGPLVHGNGFPEWATLTDGLPNPPDPFPTYYATNPALQRAFDNFWANTPGPDGVPLQEHYATAVREVAAAVADEPYVLGYDTMNEPWPGAEWLPCLTGCPELEAERLAPFNARMTAAIRAVDSDGIVFAEPFVLFNFGQADTTVGGAGAPANGLSFHVYATTPDEDEAVMDRAIASSEGTGAGLLATEWGATTDPATIDRLTGDFDTRLLPWIFWTYEHIIVRTDLPPTADNVRGPVLDALARPYAMTTNGTPTSYSFDRTTGELSYRWSTTRPGLRASSSGDVAEAGAGHGGGLPSAIVMPPRAYPDGYTATVTGGTVVSKRCASVLLVRNAPGAASVQVQVTRDGSCGPHH